jgi:hypothetical protein
MRYRSPVGQGWDREFVSLRSRTELFSTENEHREVGIANWQRAESPRDADSLISRGTPVLADDPSVLTRCDGVE